MYVFGSDGVGGVGVIELGFGFTNSGEHGGNGICVRVFGCGDVGGRSRYIVLGG